MNDLDAELRELLDDADPVLGAGRRRLRRRNVGWAIAAVVAVAAAIGVPQILARGPAQAVIPSSIPGVITAPADGDLVPFFYRFHPIGGRRAFVLRPNDPQRDPAAEFLFWNYADGLLAALKPDPDGLALVDLRGVAEGFALSAERSVAVPFKVGRVPGDYRLVAVTDRSLRLERADQAVQTLVAPDRRYPAGDDEPYRKVKISLKPVPVGADPNPSQAFCDDEGCYRTVADGRFRIRVGGSVPEAELRESLASIEMADPDDPATWFPVNEALPQSAQLRVR